MADYPDIFEMSLEDLEQPDKPQEEPKQGDETLTGPFDYLDKEGGDLSE